MTYDKLGFIHTVPSLVDQFETLATKHRDLDTVHVVDPRLLRTGSGVPSLEMDASIAAVRAHARAAHAAGAGVVVVTCSNLGPATDVVAATEPFPILRVNRPAAEEAVARAGKLLVLMTDSASVPVTEEFFQQERERQGAATEISFALVDGALELMQSGDTAAYEALIRRRIEVLRGDFDTVVLGQASMASAAVGFDDGTPVLTTPAEAVKAAVEELNSPPTPASFATPAPAPVSQLRIYRIREGLMDAWLPFFFDTLVPLHTVVGIPVPCACVNPSDPNEFVWVRQFESVDSVEEQEAQFFGTPARVALGDVRGRWVESLEVRVLTPVLSH